MARRFENRGAGRTRFPSVNALSEFYTARVKKGQGYPVRYRSGPDIPSGLNGSGVPRAAIRLKSTSGARCLLTQGLHSCKSLSQPKANTRPLLADGFSRGDLDGDR